MADPIDDLYRLPPAEFTAARDALAKQLRSEGRKEDAAAVKALRRPTVAAWALNQATHTAPEALERLLAAGRDVGTAQRRALSGVKDAGLREASQERRARIEELWAVAADVLRGAGVEPTAHRQAIADTLEAASLEQDAAAVLQAGRLSKELPAPSGFGDVAGFTLVATEAEAPAEVQEATAAEEDPSAAAARALAAAREQAATAEDEATQLEQRVADARQSAMRTAAEAERLEGRARQVRERATQLATEADDLAEQAAAARAASDDAAQRLRRMQQG